MSVAASRGLWSGDVDLVGNVNVAALASRSVAEFEATVLPAVKRCFGLSVSSLSNRHASIGEMPDRVVFCGLDPEAQTKYQKYYRLLRNPVRQRVARPEAETYKGILDSQDVFEDSSLRREKLYREFHGPQHMDRSLAIKLTSAGPNIAMLGLWRSRESRGFSAKDLLKIRCVAPVLASVYGRLTQQATDGRLEWLARILAPAEFHDPIVLLDASGRVVFANPAGEVSMSDLSRKRLILESARCPSSVPAWIVNQCARAGLGEGLSVVLDLHGSTQEIRAVRIPDKCGGGYLVHLRSASAPVTLEDDLSVYGLSNREIDVTRIAAKGLSTKQIANDMALSRFTVQDHLKSIYRKLGVNNRAGLMRFIMGFG
jgi:DNA-binding CsgD family transcriptional regulator